MKANGFQSYTSPMRKIGRSLIFRIQCSLFRTYCGSCKLIAYIHISIFNLNFVNVHPSAITIIESLPRATRTTNREPCFRIRKLSYPAIVESSSPSPDVDEFRFRPTPSAVRSLRHRRSQADAPGRTSTATILSLRAKLVLV